MTQLAERFRLHDRAGAVVEVWGFPVQLDGDPGLCEAIRAYLRDAIPVLTQSLNPESGERGTRVATLAPGSPGWLAACLRVAAQGLALRLSEVLLSEA